MTVCAREIETRCTQIARIIRGMGAEKRCLQLHKGDRERLHYGRQEDQLIRSARPMDVKVRRMRTSDQTSKAFA